jgi:hypothetical protein
MAEVNRINEALIEVESYKIRAVVVEIKCITAQNNWFVSDLNDNIGGALLQSSDKHLLTKMKIGIARLVSLVSLVSVVTMKQAKQRWTQLLREHWTWSVLQGLVVSEDLRV